MSAKVDRIALACPQCETVTHILPSQVRKERHFCCRSCAAKYQQAHHPHLQPNQKPNKGTWKAGDNTGKDHPRWVEPLIFVCHHCKEEFAVKPWKSRNPGQRNLFCSASCRGQYRAAHLAGPNAPDWVGGPKTYRGRGWLIARKAVVEDQQGCCARCGKQVGSSLPVHHIRAFREFAAAEEANVRTNLIGLCNSCHMLSEEHPTFPLTPRAVPIK